MEAVLWRCSATLIWDDACPIARSRSEDLLLPSPQPPLISRDGRLVTRDRRCPIDPEVCFAPFQTMPPRPTPQVRSPQSVDRATVRQKKTGRPVRFEMTEQTREAVDSYIVAAKEKPGEFLFGGRRGRDLNRPGIGGDHFS